MSQRNLINKEQERLDLPASMVMIIVLTLMVWEWFKPMLALTSTYTIQPFIFYFGFGILIQWFKLDGWIRAVIMSFLLLYFIHHLYIYDPFFSTAWLAYLVEELTQSITLLLAGNLYSHSFIISTFFFFLIIWFATTVIYRLVMVKQQTLYFFVLSVTFLAILDTFSPYESMYPIIRTFLYGFVLLTFTQIRRLIRNSERSDKFTERSFPLMWAVSSVLVVSVVTGLAFIAPKAAPSWPDPVSFLQGYAKGVGPGAGVNVIQRVGYGDNDQRLGGPFIDDDTLVFVADTQARGYWRGESKDIYTGKGWIQSEGEQERKSLQLTDNRLRVEQLNLSLYEQGPNSKVTRERISSTITFEEPSFATIFYPGDPHEAMVDPTDMNNAFLQVNRKNASLTLYNELDERNEVYGYSIESDNPRFSTLALLESSMADVPRDLLQQYTQLPDSLPERVRELAVEVTKEAETDYEKVKRIERYFGANGYEYNTEDVAIPREDEDYVDQFLFDTMRGYCDNFSSAMVVMLRTLEIPARWVKGFTFGDITASLDGKYTTEVRNQNAHSWVEVYFPNIGWVPFEPTQSFNNPYTFERDDIDTSGSTSSSLPFDPLEDPFGEEMQREEDDPAFMPGGSGNKDSWLQGKVWLILGCISLLTAALVVFFRRTLILSWAIIRYREATDRQTFFHLYTWLILYLGRFIQPRDSSQTMREYVIALEEKIKIEELKPITQAFESLRYGKRQDDMQLRSAYQLWRSIVNKLKSFYS